MEGLEDKRIWLLHFCYLQLCITAFISFFPSWDWMELGYPQAPLGISFRIYINLQSLYGLHYFNTWAPHNLSLSLLSQHPRRRQFLLYQFTKRESKRIEIFRYLMSRVKSKSPLCSFYSAWDHPSAPQNEIQDNLNTEQGVTHRQTWKKWD